MSFVIIDNRYMTKILLDFIRRISGFEGSDDDNENVGEVQILPMSKFDTLSTRPASDHSKICLIGDFY